MDDMDEDPGGQSDQAAGHGKSGTERDRHRLPRFPFDLLLVMLDLNVHEFNPEIAFFVVVVAQPSAPTLATVTCETARSGRSPPRQPPPRQWRPQTARETCG